MALTEFYFHYTPIFSCCLLWFAVFWSHQLKHDTDNWYPVKTPSRTSLALIFDIDFQFHSFYCSKVMPHGFALKPCGQYTVKKKKILLFNAWIWLPDKATELRGMLERTCWYILVASKTKCKPLEARLLCSLIYCYFMISFRENKSWGITAILHGVWKFPKVLKEGGNFDRNSSPLKTKTILG